MFDVLGQIESIRRRAHGLLIAQRVAVLLAWSVGVLVVLAFFDYLVRLPSEARAAIDVLLVAALLIALWRYLWPAIAFRPSTTDLALRIENALPQLRGHLASGVEFAATGADRESGFAAQAVSGARQRAGRENLAALINRRRTFSDAGIFLAAAAAVAVLCVALPQHAAIATQRWVNPFGDAQWLKRTGVESATTFAVHPLGRAMPLRARVIKGLSDDMRVYAHYRFVREDGTAGEWDRVILTRQRDDLFERLVEPESDASVVELWFESEDDWTEEQAIRLVPPPAIAAAQVTIEPPAYAAGMIPAVKADLGPGTDERAVLSLPALEGSRASLQLTFNKPLPVGEAATNLAMLGWEQDAREAGASPAGEAIALGDAVEFSDAPDIQKTLVDDLPTLTTDAPSGEPAATWTLSWTLRETTRLHPILVDEFGVTGADDVFYRIEVKPDAPPSVSITAPTADHSYLPSAEVALQAEGRDDVRLGDLSLEARVAEEGRTPAAPAGEERAIDLEGFSTLASRVGEADMERLDFTLELSALAVQPGDVVEVVAAATDGFELDGRRHEPARSTPRRLRIITDAEFVAQIHQNLAGVRDSAIRLEQEQHELRERLAQNEVQPDDLREQGRVGQRLDRQREILDEIAQRLAENRLGDADLQGLVDEARGMVEAAGQASNRASESMSEARERRSETDEQAQQIPREIDEAQQAVADELAALIELLDQGQDSWVMRRQVEQLLEDQRRLESESRDVTADTRGKSDSQLTPAQREALDELAQRQESLADRARQLTESLEERAEDLKPSDPDLSDAMRQAASEAQQQQLEETMQQAAQQLDANQGQRAGQQQQQAMQTLQSMLDRLEDTEKAKAERLQRQLDSLVQSLDALVREQEAQLARLAQAMADQTFADDLDDAMLRLNANTYAVLDQTARQRELAPVGRLIESAGHAQERAIGALRVEPAVDAPTASAEENRSLADLKAARDLAQKLLEQMQQNEQQRRKQELIQAYKDLHERQIALKAETQPLAEAGGDGELDRRQRVTARQLGNRQAEIRNAASDLLRQTSELAEALVFAASHEQIDALAASIVETLREGMDVGPMTTMRQQDVADHFLALAEALQDSQDQSEFSPPSGGGGGGGNQPGGQQPPLIPPVAQLKLLRAVQESIYRSTRLVDGGADADAGGVDGATLDAADREARIQELGQSQQRLTELAGELILQLQQQGGGGGDEPLPPPPPPPQQ